MILGADFLEVTAYKNLHICFSKFYKKTIISRGPPVRASRTPTDLSLGNTGLHYGAPKSKHVSLRLPKLKQKYFMSYMYIVDI